ncbi:MULTISPECIES: CsgG/HfaB family protein [unclassified Carboxylicivirga]|uniref:CsgG/HfaB family protein n=1 Tax=Carboxylicivirga TaxID=1628153 RepID=UPI003D32C028
MKLLKTLPLSLVIFLLLGITHSKIQAQSTDGKKVLKRKVAIGRFTNVTKQSQSIFYDQEADQLGKQAADILATKLVASEKFILIERQDYDKIVSELEKSNTMTQNIGADFLIIGSVTELGRKTIGNQKVFSSSVKQAVEAGVSMRLVDVTTGLIIYSGEGKGSAEVQDKRVMGFGETADFDATLTDKAIGAAINQLVENIINSCMDKPWQAYILAEDEGSLIISGGETQGIAAGDVYGVLSPGKKVKNPQTGITIELPGKVVGKITIDMTIGDTPQNEVSMATLTEGEVDMENLSKYRIVENK